MKQKGGTANKKYLVYLVGKILLLAIVTPPVLAEGSTGINTYSILTSIEYGRDAAVQKDAERNTDSHYIINNEPGDSSRADGCCTGEEDKNTYDFTACKFILEDSLLEPIFMIACLYGNRQTVI